MSQKKRLLLVGGILLVLVLALVAVYFWPKPVPPTPAVDKTVVLHQFEETAVTSVVVTRPDATLTFVKNEEGEWQFSGRQAAEVDNAFVFDTVYNAAVLTAIEKLADAAENYADYGLEEPAVSVSVYGADGLLSTLHFGNITLDRSAYYARLGDNPEIYLVADAVVRPFQYTPTQYLRKDVFTLALNDIDRFALRHPDHGEIVITRTADPEEEGLLGVWEMTKPYQKTVRAQETEDWLKSILAIVAEDLVEGTSKAGEYGLTAPAGVITFNAKDGTVEQAVFSTEHSALRKIGRDRLYLLSDKSLKFLETDPFAMLDPFLCKVDVATLNAFEWDGHHIDLTTYEIDGKKVEEKAFKNAYLELMMITIMASAQETDRTVLGSNPVFAYGFTGKDGSRHTVKLYAVNAQTCLAEVDSRADFRVDIQKVKTAQSAFNALLEE